MDFTSAFKDELFRPFVVLLIPGFLAVSPFVLVAGNWNHEVALLFKAQPFAFFGAYLALITAAGLMLENFGAAIERGIDDCLDSHNLPDMHEEWGKYLQLAMKDEIVGQRFLRTLVVRAKFIQSVIPALLICYGGFLVLALQLQRWWWVSVVVVGILLGLVVVGFFAHLVSLCEAMANVRTDILQAKGVAIGSSYGKPYPGRWMCAKYVNWHIRGYRSEHLGGLKPGFKSWFVLD
ncbi:hypothetical protein [Arenimonas sp.]|uniref:hypothetical protein n=1 Tax=Arenimonas sp. TaxID=1872635 RepID=UPI0039E3DAF2